MTTEANLFFEPQVHIALQECVPCKDSGPNGVSIYVGSEVVCWWSLSNVMGQIFNRCIATSLNYSKIKSPVDLKKPKHRFLIDYWPNAHTSATMKCFEHRLCEFLFLNEHQFAYNVKRSAKDACISLNDSVWIYLDKLKSYVSTLFAEFLSAFNAYFPNILLDRLSILEA